MINLELSQDVAADVLSLLERETEGYTSVEEHAPERIKSLRQAISTLSALLEVTDEHN